MNNYIEFDNWSIRYRHFCYIDSDACLADNIFIRQKLRVKFKFDMMNQDNKYRIVFCKVPKKCISKFKECMQILENNMLLCGYSDYNEVCEYYTHLA